MWWLSLTAGFAGWQFCPAQLATVSYVENYGPTRFQVWSTHLMTCKLSVHGTWIGTRHQNIIFVVVELSISWVCLAKYIYRGTECVNSLVEGGPCVHNYSLIFYDTQQMLVFNESWRLNEYSIFVYSSRVQSRIAAEPLFLVRRWSRKCSHIDTLATSDKLFFSSYVEMDI